MIKPFLEDTSKMNKYILFQFIFFLICSDKILAQSITAKFAFKRVINFSDPGDFGIFYY